MPNDGRGLRRRGLLDRDDQPEGSLARTGRLGEGHREAAARGVESALSASAVRVLPQSPATFADGFALYRARPDKGHSLTDCIAMAAMRREAITEVLASDAHFRQEGFLTLL